MFDMLETKTIHAGNRSYRLDISADSSAEDHAKGFQALEDFRVEYRANVAAMTGDRGDIYAAALARGLAVSERPEPSQPPRFRFHRFDDNDAAGVSFHYYAAPSVGAAHGFAAAIGLAQEL